MFFISYGWLKLNKFILSQFNECTKHIFTTLPTLISFICPTLSCFAPPPVCLFHIYVFFFNTLIWLNHLCGHRFETVFGVWRHTRWFTIKESTPITQQGSVSPSRPFPNHWWLSTGTVFWKSSADKANISDIICNDFDKLSK